MELRFNSIDTEIVSDYEKDFTSTERTIKIAVLDSGVDYATSDANILKTVNFVEEDQDCEEMLMDMTGHGSAVAGIISIINPEAEIYSVRILDKDNTTSLSRAVKGINWCINNDVNIINMSFGTETDYEPLHDAIKEASEKGILLIASAGNDSNKMIEYPAKYAEVMCVGSVNDEGLISKHNAWGEEIGENFRNG